MHLISDESAAADSSFQKYEGWKYGLSVVGSIVETG